MGIWSRNFTLLWFGGLASYSGMWAMQIALPLFVFQQTRSTLAAGLVLTAQFTPLILTSLAGVLVDRWDRRAALVGANLAMVVLTALLLLPATTGLSASTTWLVYVCVVAIAVAGLVVVPAENSLLPTLVESRHLLAANSLNALNDNLARILGPAIGGLLAATVGLTGVVVLNLATYATAAVLIGLIRTPTAAPATPEPVHSRASAIGTFGSQWLEGVRQVRASRAVVVVFASAALVMFGDSMFGALLAPFVDTAFTEAALVFGLFVAARGVGGLLGGFLAAAFGRLWSPRTLLTGSCLAFGALLAALVALPVVWMVVTCAVLLGIASIAWSATIQTTVQTEVANRYLGRVFGSYATVNAVTMTLGSAIAAVAAGQLGVATVLFGAAGLYALGGVVALVAFPRREVAGPQG